MKLETYLEKENLSAAQFGRKIKRSKQIIYDYLHGKKYPSRETLDRIFLETSGLVKANDFFGQGDTSDEN